MKYYVHAVKFPHTAYWSALVEIHGVQHTSVGDTKQGAVASLARELRELATVFIEASENLVIDEPKYD